MIFVTRAHKAWKKVLQGSAVTWRARHNSACEYFRAAAIICLPSGAGCCYSRSTLTEPLQLFMTKFFFTGYFYFSNSNPKAVE